MRMCGRWVGGRAIGQANGWVNGQPPACLPACMSVCLCVCMLDLLKAFYFNMPNLWSTILSNVYQF